MSDQHRLWPRYRIEIHDYETHETAVYEHAHIEVISERALVIRDDGDPGTEGSALRVTAWTREGPSN